MMPATRREFLRTGLAAGAGLALGTGSPASEPIRRNGKSHLRLSIAGYSYRKYLDLKIQPRPPMTLDDFVDLAAGMNLDAVELTEYYFAQTTPDYLAHLKGHCTRLGLDVSGTAIRNDFCLRDAARLRREINHVKRWVEHTSRLGGKTIRIFAGKPAKGDSEEQARQRCAAAISEACDHAGKYGIYLALENHPGVADTIEQTLALVQAVQHPWFGVNWDTGNFHSPDPYADLTRLAPYAVTVQIKTEMQRAGHKPEAADLKRLVGILRAADYRGYVALEYEAAEDPMTAIPRHIEKLKRLMG